MFDVQRGQVFDEKIIRLPRIDDRDWPLKVPTSLCQKYRPSKLPGYEEYCKTVEKNRWPRIVRSVRPLLDMSLGVFVSNLRRLPAGTLIQLPAHLLCHVGKVIIERFAELEALGGVPNEIFECLPLPIIEEIWATVNQRAQMNLDIWKMLSKRLLSENDSAVKELGLRRYRQKFESANSELPFYTNPITSPSFDFLTSLSIAIRVPMRDLIRLADIVNLGILEIYDAPPTIKGHHDEVIVADRVFRVWAGLAAEKNAFPVLRVLKFRMVNGLTRDSLRHFNSFPALGVIYPGVSGMMHKVYDEASKLGWATVPPRRLRTPFGLEEAQIDQVKESFHLPKAWHFGQRCFPVGVNHTIWDGCDVTKLQSKNINELIDALNHIETPTHDIYGCAINPEDSTLQRDSHYDFSDIIRGESWRKVDWNLFCETIRQKQEMYKEIWDWESLEEFICLSHLRFDSDLLNAGVKECGLGIASVGSTFKRIISITPIVSIYLGPEFEDEFRCVYPSPRGFIRIKVPERKPNLKRAKFEPTEGSSSTATEPPNKRSGIANGRTLRPQKIQKFEDFFGGL